MSTSKVIPLFPPSETGSLVPPWRGKLHMTLLGFGFVPIGRDEITGEPIWSKTELAPVMAAVGRSSVVRGNETVQ